ncbi:MAG: hypothetical protein COT45_03780 [bacterium (Candidatus Stahlbacteria) CG08_land_8_20_14_0_20_40_26]|nr:MAG: hypothetical protein COX49_04850 [bacterium (Candidatus Stahlbacteria) CG23_combo_of_CG06-09_8_20_14_all_40_9]PIS24715.1 MAG: hypothetical protein COT45_03780 [bacterium (Candidatus Stahlbacteria) CG08_land_8_20_14_0_20_40_26]
MISAFSIFWWFPDFEQTAFLNESSDISNFRFPWDTECILRDFLFKTWSFYREVDLKESGGS